MTSRSVAIGLAAVTVMGAWGLGGVRQAHADANTVVVQLSAESPFRGLPAVSSDGAFVALPGRVEATGDCFGDVLTVSIVPVGPGKPQVFTIADGCHADKRYSERKALEQSLPEVNDTLAALRFEAAKLQRPPEGLALPVTFSVDELKITVGGKKNKLDVAAKLGKKTLGKKSAKTKLKAKSGAVIGAILVRAAKPMAYVEIEWYVPGPERNQYVSEWVTVPLKGLPALPPSKNGDGR